MLFALVVFIVAVAPVFASIQSAAHELAELADIVLALLFFSLIWYSRNETENGYLLIVGVAFLFAGIFALLHFLTDHGIIGFDLNLLMQFWTAEHFIISVTFLAAAVWGRRKVSSESILCSGLVVMAGISLAIRTGLFPDCYIDGVGLTAFKTGSGVARSVLFAVSVVLLRRTEGLFSRRTITLLSVALILYAASELLLLNYPTGNERVVLAGHVVELGADLFLYRAIVVAAIADPSELLFRRLKASEADLRNARDRLEISVRERTAELVAANEQINSILASIRDAFFTIDGAGNIIFTNEEARILLSSRAPAGTGGDFWATLTADRSPFFREQFAQARRSRVPVRFETASPWHEGWIKVSAYPSEIGFSVFVQDVTARKEMERNVEVTSGLLRLFATSETRAAYLKDATAVLREWCRCSNLGLRLKDGGGNATFEACDGYSLEFLEAERVISFERDQCICARVIRADPGPLAGPWWTASGSFFTNDLAALVQRKPELSGGDFRGVCVSQGFRSLAVVPIRHREMVLGVIHVADERAGVVPKAVLEMLERASLMLGEALFRFDVEQDLRKNFEALQVSEQLYRSLVERVQDIIFEISPAGTIESLNPAFETILGWSSDAWIGRNYQSIMHPEDVPVAEAYFQPPENSANAPLFEVRIQAKNGSYRIMELKVTRPHGEEGAVLGIARDITERKRTEEERALLAAAVESARDAIVVTEPTRGSIVYVNRAFEQMTGYSRAEAIGSTHHMLESGSHDEGFFSQIAETIRRDGVWWGVLKNRRKEGTLYDEESTISAVTTSDGTISNYIYIKRDVTAKLRLESIADSVNAMDTIGFVFSGVRHEIGNPIHAVNMLLGSIRAKADTLSREEIMECIGRISEQIARVEYLLRSLKTFNLYETQEPKTVDLREFLDRFLPLVSADLGQRRIALEVLQNGALHAQVDPRALQQILLNVITNAADAMDGRVAPLIVIETGAVDHRVRIKVRDNGSGIPARRLKEVFRPFYTTKPQGTGLGLVIVKRMLTRMGGSIDIASTEGEGTVVDIFLPEARS